MFLNFFDAICSHEYVLSEGWLTVQILILLLMRGVVFEHGFETIPTTPVKNGATRSCNTVGKISKNKHHHHAFICMENSEGFNARATDIRNLM